MLVLSEFLETCMKEVDLFKACNHISFVGFLYLN